MKTQCCLKAYKSGSYSYIYVYFKHSKDIIRINTGNKVIEGKMTADMLYKSTVEGYEKLNKDTNLLISKVNNYINLRSRETNKPRFNQTEALRFIKEDYYKNINGSGINSYKYLLEQREKEENKTTVLKEFDKFIRIKSTMMNTDVYNTVRKILVELELKQGKVLDFDAVNDMEFITNFRESLYNRKQCDNTVIKNMKLLKHFYKYIQESDLYTFKVNIFNNNTSTFKKDIITLSTDEIKKLMDIKPKKKQWVIILDEFILNCFCGLRYSDLITLNEDEIIEDKDKDYAIVKGNQKTGITVNIPLNNVAMTILRKYDFNLPKYTNKHFNEQLLKIFEHYDLFNDKVIIKQRVKGKILDYSTEKRNAITSHNCRKTFITNSLKAGISFPSVMAASGHLEAKTLRSYLNINQDKSEFKKMDIAI